MNGLSNGMQSLTELYRIGRGPSSSHTIGPERACLLFLKRNSSADSFKVVLYGSLAKTGKGHGTDSVIRKTLAPHGVDVVFNPNETDIPHPNTMDMYAYTRGRQTAFLRVLSVGGGAIEIVGEEAAQQSGVYPHTSFSAIKRYCADRNIPLCRYAGEMEGEDIYAYLAKVWTAMKSSIEAGLSDSGTLPGGLNIEKKAKFLYSQCGASVQPTEKENLIVCAYAFAASEQNACGERVVTAPTCGSCGVLPATLYYQQKRTGCSDEKIVLSLATAGIVGNLIKTNASISGAECGCQAEIGSACAMAAAALGEFFSFSADQTEYAAEIALEHHLGLTCDPICGLVQIPCIERNAVAAMRAMNAVDLAEFLYGTRRISLDGVIETMRQTGLDLRKEYKETSEGGLARLKI